jgi:RHS repeat-associated protein
MLSLLRSSCLLLLLIFATSLASAQTQTGTPPFGSFGGGPDVIDLANLDSHISIPIIHRAGRGTGFVYNLNYESLVWYPVTSGGVTTWQPTNNWGWNAQTAVATGFISSTQTQQKCFDSHHVLIDIVVTTSNFVYHGNALTQLGHFPFGESWYNASSDKLLFTTYERDVESGNDYAMARYYVNRLGRFNSPDPVPGSISDSQSLNRYLYTENNPINATDPSGMVTIACKDADLCFFLGGSGGGGGQTCTVDGADMPCWMAYGLVGAGFAAQCPNNDCSPRADNNGNFYRIVYEDEYGFQYVNPNNPNSSFGNARELGLPSLESGQTFSDPCAGITPLQFDYTSANGRTHIENRHMQLVNRTGGPTPIDKLSNGMYRAAGQYLFQLPGNTLVQISKFGILKQKKAEHLIA